MGRRFFHRLGSLSLLLACGSLTSAAAPQDGENAPFNPFAGEARGPYPTGTVEELWIDEQRAEVLTEDAGAHRRLMVQIWYPAELRGEGSKVRCAPYALHGGLYPNDEKSYWLAPRARGAQSRSVLNAPLARSGGRLPILVFNPGNGQPPFSATFLTEFLASHGYVIVGIGRPDTSRIRRFPDGTEYRMKAADPFAPLDPRRAPAGDSQIDEWRASRDLYIRERLPIHLADVRFVLDRLAALDDARASKFRGRLDLERVGAVGKSLGGPISLQAMQDDPRVKAAVNLDGWLYTDVTQSGLTRPFMQMRQDWLRAYHGKAAAGERELWLLGNADFWRLYARSPADWYDVTLKGAGHGHFDDRVSFIPPREGEMSASRAHELVNQYVLAFFDRYLRAVPSPWLSDSQIPADAEFLKSVSHGAH